MKVTIELRSGPGHSRYVTPADIQKNIDALQHAIDGKPQSCDFASLTDTKCMLLAIQRQLAGHRDMTAELSNALPAALQTLLAVVWDQVVANGWVTSTEKRLKYLASEVVELACAATAGKPATAEECDEALHVLWNALAFLSERNASPSMVSDALTRLIARNWVTHTADGE